MAAALEVFTDPDRGWQVRTVLVEGDPWFVAADVCAALGHTNGRRAVAQHVDEIDKGVTDCDTPGGRQRLTTVNEAGLWSLVFGSHLPAAREFRRWVTSVVLPEIRRTGSFNAAAAPAFEVPTTYVGALELALAQARQLETQSVALAAAAPKVEFHDRLVAAAGDWSVREAAQILDRDPAISTGERRLFQTLVAIGWLDRTRQPYQGHVDRGRMVRRVGHYRDASTGELVAYSTVRITPKGLTDLHHRLGGAAQLVEITEGAA
jgi:anti-repressor protein